jgi:hypothetical protein
MLALLEQLFFGLEVDLRHFGFMSPFIVIPVKAGIQRKQERHPEVRAKRASKDDSVNHPSRGD